MSKEIRKNLAMLSVIVSVLITTTIPVLGYNQDNPASYTVQYVIPIGTTFILNLCGSETNMNFNPENGNNKSVAPDCQKETGLPWATITNQGNVNLNFSINLTTPNPIWVKLDIASNSSMADRVTVTDVEIAPAGWNNVAPGNTVNIYSIADFTDAPVGSASRTIKIYSK